MFRLNLSLRLGPPAGVVSRRLSATSQGDRTWHAGGNGSPRSRREVSTRARGSAACDPARNGDGAALDPLIRRYTGFVRLKASSYFLAGGESDDLIQEGMIGLYKAVRDFRSDKETSFRSFAELCVTRQIITAIKTATRFKHPPLNTYVSFSHTPAGQEGDGDCTLGDALPGSRRRRPGARHLHAGAPEPRLHARHRLVPARGRCAALYLEGLSYEDMAVDLGCDTKTIDNALQRVKRKILVHQKSREVLK